MFMHKKNIQKMIWKWSENFRSNQIKSDQITFWNCDLIWSKITFLPNDLDLISDQNICDLSILWKFVIFFTWLVPSAFLGPKSLTLHITLWILFLFWQDSDLIFHLIDILFGFHIFDTTFFYLIGQFIDRKTRINASRVFH